MFEIAATGVICSTRWTANFNCQLREAPSPGLYANLKDGPVHNLWKTAPIMSQLKT
jgi:hypothetical protein